MNTDFEPKNGYEDDLALQAFRVMMGQHDEIDADATRPNSPLLDLDDADEFTLNQQSSTVTNSDISEFLKDLQFVTIDKQVSDDENDATQELADTFSTSATDEATKTDILILLRAQSTESEQSTTGKEVSDFISPNLTSFNSIRPAALTQLILTDEHEIKPSNEPVTHRAHPGVPEDPFAQSAGQFRALRTQLNALLIASEFRRNAPESAVRALEDLKTTWTTQATQFARHHRTPYPYALDVLKRNSLQSLAQVKRELAAQGNLWHRYVRPLLNALISWFAYVESCLGVPNRFQPRLFKATYAEEAFKTLQPERALDEVLDAYARDMSVALAVQRIST